MHQLKNGAFKHIESELYHYHDTLKEMRRIRDDILSGTSNRDENQGGGKSNIPGDPTAQRAIALSSNRKLENLERICDTIETVVSGLPPEKRKLVQLKYWDRPQVLTWDGIAIKLNVSRKTAFRWRQDIVEMIGAMLGW